MKIEPKNKKLSILISGEELSELQRYTYHMAEAFGLDMRIENYQGKRPIGLYSWDFDCLLAVIDCVIDDPKEYPDKEDQGYKALKSLLDRLKKNTVNLINAFGEQPSAGDRQGLARLKKLFQVVNHQLIKKSVEALAAPDRRVMTFIPYGDKWKN